MDLTPIVPAGRQVIERYGNGGFRVTGVDHRGSILILPDATMAWAPTAADILTIDDFTPLFGKAQILLLGCGERMALVPAGLRDALRDQGLIVDSMRTDAACRTYNVLMAEDRRVAGALIAV
jgi:uncharacterized protein